MHRVVIGDKTYTAAEGTRLSELLISERLGAAHPCGGRGDCGKCRVRVNGEWVLSCGYEIRGDVTVELPHRENISSPTGLSPSGKSENADLFVLDIGTTALALCRADSVTGEVAELITRANPQRLFGADIMSRILRCMSGDTAALQEVLTREIDSMLEPFAPVSTLFVTGNTTMLHLLFGIDPSDMGTYPYTPVFLASRRASGAEAGLLSVTELISLPCHSAFIGADIVCGLESAGLPSEGKLKLLIDLGTNAEIVLFSDSDALCTSAAAGPCFEGVGISCGMAATEGAIYSYRAGSIKTVGGAPATGLCATGLIDAVAFLLDSGAVDSAGFMAEGEYELARGVTLKDEDVRQLQLAKSAVCSAILCLMNIRGASAEDIEDVIISGGFSEKLSVRSAVRIGLIPPELENKCISMGSTALQGAVKYAAGSRRTEKILENMSYADLSSHPDFTGLFMKNMMFR